VSEGRDRLAALERGGAFVDLSSWWKVRVTGADAAGWLNDLLTADLDGIAAGEMRPSMLLTPTGKIRAVVGVIAFDGGFLLLQDPIQPTRIDEFLSPYVLSSDVRLSDRTEELAILAMPSAAGAGDQPSFSPSVLGPGIDVIAPAGSVRAVESLQEAGLEDVDAWRVRKGVARFGVDLTSDSLPHEVELGDMIAHAKGCFLGQESVARVRNLGRPPFVLLAAAAEGPVGAGDLVSAASGEAGIITSASSVDGTAVIARVRWALKDVPLRTALGVELRVRGLASAA
jgi:folate-binding protein YgfZ